MYENSRLKEDGNLSRKKMKLAVLFNEIFFSQKKTSKKNNIIINKIIDN